MSSVQIGSPGLVGSKEDGFDKFDEADLRKGKSLLRVDGVFRFDPELGRIVRDGEVLECSCESGAHCDGRAIVQGHLRGEDLADAGDGEGGHPLCKKLRGEARVFAQDLISGVKLVAEQDRVWGERARADWSIRLTFGAAALALMGFGYGFAWFVDHSAIPALIALAEVLR